MMKNNFMGVIFTNHAIKRLHDRKIAQSDAWYTFKHPDKQTRGKISDSWKFTKTYGPQKIEVIAKQNENKQWVILSCWSKRIGSGQSIFSQKENYFENLINKFLALVKPKNTKS